MESLTWIDDGTPPKLEELGKLDVELYVGEVRFLFFLSGCLVGWLTVDGGCLVGLDVDACGDVGEECWA